MKQRLMRLTLIAGVAAIGLAAMPAETQAFGCLFGHHCHRRTCCRPCCPPPCCPRPCCPQPCYRPCAPACCGAAYYHAAPTYHHAAPGCCAVPRWSAPTYAVTPVAPQPVSVVRYGYAPVLRGF